MSDIKLFRLGNGSDSQCGAQHPPTSPAATAFITHPAAPAKFVSILN